MGLCEVPLSMSVLGFGMDGDYIYFVLLHPGPEL